MKEAVVLVWIALALGTVAAAVAGVVAARALRTGWAASSPAVIERVVRRATDEEIETTLTADLFAGVIDGDLYRRALELLAAHDAPVPGPVHADLPQD